MRLPLKLFTELAKIPGVVMETFNPFRYKNLYHKLYRKHKHNYPDLRMGDLGKVLTVFHEHIFQELLNNRQGVLLPYGLGKICIISKDVPYNQLKWNKQVYETNGKSGIVLYDNELGIKSIVDKSMWIFYLQEPMQFRVRDKYKEDYMFYMNAYNKRGWWKSFVENPEKKAYIPRERPSDLDGYNEFEF